MIEFQKVSKSYNPYEFALRDVDLHIEQGEFVFLRGPNGAGKTSLLKLINVMEKPSSGEVIIEGKSSRSMRRKDVARLRRRIGVILQDLRLLQGRTVEGNVRLALEVSDAQRNTHTVKLVKVLTYLGLLSKRDLYPSELSWGEQQKVSIARAIVNQPFVLLADEPTEKLDEQASSEILDIIRDVNLWGTTVILASHNPVLMVKGVDRVVSLNRGILEGDVAVRDPSVDRVAK